MGCVRIRDNLLTPRLFSEWGGAAEHRENAIAINFNQSQRAMTAAPEAAVGASYFAVSRDVGAVSGFRA